MENNFQNNFQKGFAAKKSLGQNFLHAPHIIGKMIHAAEIIAGESAVLEVGPGKGVLTQGLLDAGAHVVAVEKDDRAIVFLKEKFADEIEAGQLRLIHGDILELDPAMLGLLCGKYIIVANIPYYITGEFLRKFLEVDCGPEKMVLMLQKEVAKRIVGDGGKNGQKNKNGAKESILSISVKAYGLPKYVTTVPARHFRPVPKVDSAVLLIDQISKDFLRLDDGKSPQFEREFFEIVRAGFAHKRKVLIKNLETLVPREILSEKWQEMALLPTVRAESLSPNEWKQIALLFHNKKA
jgi:16S rRNA (adenine1518-N6/adenine1519-N6)-dimethyltransferase